MLAHDRATAIPPRFRGGWRRKAPGGVHVCDKVLSECVWRGFAPPGSRFARSTLPASGEGLPRHRLNSILAERTRRPIRSALLVVVMMMMVVMIAIAVMVVMPMRAVAMMMVVMTIAVMLRLLLLLRLLVVRRVFVVLPQ
jgi:hypothetical protein